MSDYDVKDWLSIVLSVIALGTVLVGWFRFGGNKAMEALDSYKSKSGGEIKALDDRLDRHGDRLMSIENDIRHMPSKDDISGLKLQMSEMNGEVGKLAQRFGPVEKKLDRIDDYLTKGGA